MEKKLWKLVACLSIMLFAFGVSSCSKDDDEVGSEQELVGTWNIIHEEGYQKENGEVIKSWDDTYPEGKETIIFYEDHSTGGTSMDGGMKWSYNGNKIRFDWEDDGEEDFEESTVLEMTSTRLVMEVYEKENYSGTTHEDYVKITCTRASK